MLNKIILMGRLTRDPELRRTGSGLAVASFTLAVDRDFGSRESGEKETDFIDIVAWCSTAEFVCKYFTKGRMAIVSGRLQIRNWTDKDGGKRRSAEVVAENVYFGDSKPKAQEGYPPAPPGYQAQPSAYQPNYRDTPPSAHNYTPEQQAALAGLNEILDSDLQIPFGELFDDDGQLPY